MTNHNHNNDSPIESLEVLERYSQKCTEDIIYTLADVYWDARTQRRILRKSIENNPGQEEKLVLEYFENKFLKLEHGFKKSIKTYCQEFEVGRWALDQYGVGPLSVVRLLRYVDVTKARSHEQLWAYAGLAPKSGPSQTYNNNLKDTCIDLGRSFVRHADKPQCFYGQLYTKELERRIELNEKGAYSDLLKEESHFAGKKIQHDGPEKLSLDRLRAQSQRYAVKIFLIHWYSLEYKEVYGEEYITGNKNIIPIPSI